MKKYYKSEVEAEWDSLISKDNQKVIKNYFGVAKDKTPFSYEKFQNFTEPPEIHNYSIQNRQVKVKRFEIDLEDLDSVNEAKHFEFENDKWNVKNIRDSFGKHNNNQFRSPSQQCGKSRESKCKKIWKEQRRSKS
jgi:hypothetical protein